VKRGGRSAVALSTVAAGGEITQEKELKISSELASHDFKRIGKRLSLSLALAYIGSDLARKLPVIKIDPVFQA
jgi:hypothetical protein